MNITEIKVSLFNQRSLRAFVDIVIDDAFIIRGMKVIENDGRVFVSMPSRRDKNGQYRDIAHPVNVAAREVMESLVLSAYEKERDHKYPVKATGS